MCNQCNEYKKVIKELCQDKAFGILTRNGLEYAISNSYDNSSDDIIPYITLLDFCNVSKMNIMYGYEKVNKKFTKLFMKYKKNNLIGRCFSGDEIIIITEDYRFIDKMKKEGVKLNLFFRWTGTLFKGNIDDHLPELYTNLNKGC